MSVVELDGHLLRQLVPFGVRLPEAPHQIAQGTGDQEIFLNKAQALAETGRIVRIQHPRERFGGQSLRNGADEVTMAECFEIEGIRGGRSPKAEGVDGLAPKANDWPVVGHTD